MAFFWVRDVYLGRTQARIFVLIMPLVTNLGNSFLLVPFHHAAGQSTPRPGPLARICRWAGYDYNREMSFRLQLGSCSQSECYSDTDTSLLDV